MAKTTQDSTWKSRIVGNAEVDPRELAEHPKNWRIHNHKQREKMKGILDTIGYVEGALVNKNTNTILDGHMRVALAITQGAATIPVIYVNITEEEENIVLSTHDPIKSIAHVDSRKFDGLRQAVGERNPALAALVDWSAKQEPEEKTEPDDEDEDGYDDNLEHLQDRSGLERDHEAIFGEDDSLDPEAEDISDVDATTQEPVNDENPYTAMTVRQLRFTVSVEDYDRALDVLDHVILNQVGCSTNAEATLWLINTYGG